MNAIDFEYDGQYLSDYGFIICDFNGSDNAETVNIGSTISFNLSPQSYGKYFVLTSTEYSDYLTIEFDICKNPDEYDDLIITNDEFRYIIRWLNRKELLKFRIIEGEDNTENDEPYFFNASFNVEKIKIREKLCGIHLTMVTDKPFAYGEEEVYNWNVTDTSDTYTIIDMSDEIGVDYPLVTITCKASGNLSITNETYDVTMTINNCAVDEVITIDCLHKVITSSVTNHEIYNDFNFEFLTIQNSYDERENVYSFTKQCEIEIRYTPIIKNLP